MAEPINLGNIKGPEGQPGPPGAAGADAPTDYEYSDAEIDTVNF